MDMAIGKGGIWYVINRSNAMWAPNSLRITCVPWTKSSSVILGILARATASLSGQSASPLTGKDRVYVSDKHRHDIQVFEADGTYVHKFGGSGGHRPVQPPLQHDD